MRVEEEREKREIFFVFLAAENAVETKLLDVTMVNRIYNRQVIGQSCYTPPSPAEKKISIGSMESR